MFCNTLYELLFKLRNNGDLDGILREERVECRMNPAIYSVTESCLMENRTTQYWWSKMMEGNGGRCKSKPPWDKTVKTLCLVGELFWETGNELFRNRWRKRRHYVDILYMYSTYCKKEGTQLIFFPLDLDRNYVCIKNFRTCQSNYIRRIWETTASKGRKDQEIVLGEIMYKLQSDLL